MKKIIKLTESDLEQIIKKVLNEQTFPGTSSGEGLGYREPKANINPKGLKFGMGGKYDSKNSDDVKELQSKLIELGLLSLKNGPTGYFGKLTQSALDRYLGKTTNVVPSKPNEKTNKVSDVKSNGRCVGLPKDLCSKISATKPVNLGSGEEAQCAAYVTKCLTQYDKDFRAGNAWKTASWLSAGGGTEKFNLFKTNVNWNKIWQGLKANKIAKSDCDAFYGKQSSDIGTFKSKSNTILNLSSENAPDSSSANWRNLKPGDVVGLWHDGTSNKGRAFCERLVDDLKLDDKGNFKELPFTFNTHVGFVTAVKDGIPIIAHNVGNSFHTKGYYSAVPVTQMLSKGSPDRIVWAYSDPQIESAVQKSFNSEPEYKIPKFPFNK